MDIPIIMNCTGQRNQAKFLGHTCSASFVLDTHFNKYKKEEIHLVSY